MDDTLGNISPRKPLPLNLRYMVLAACLVSLGGLGLVFIRNLVDFPVYYAAGQSLLAGRIDLYAADFARGPLMDYRYPPFFLVAFSPIWLLPYGVAAYLWYLFGLLEIAGCGFILSKTLRSFVETGPALWKVWVVTVLATAQYFVLVLHYGNVHLLVVFLLFASFYLVLTEKPLWAAAAMALAITIKVIPILLLPYFALRKQWRFVFLVTAILAILNLAPSLYFGFGRNVGLLKTWYSHVIADQSYHEVNGPINLSIKGEFRRCLTQVDYNQRLDGDRAYPGVNLARISNNAVDLIWGLLAAFVYFGALALIWRTVAQTIPSKTAVSFHHQASGPLEFQGVSRHLPMEFGLMLCLLLLVEPLTSKIYFIALSWPVAVLAARLLNQKGSVPKRLLITLAAVNFVLPLIPGRSAQRLFLVLGTDFWLSCLVLALLVVCVIAKYSKLKTQD